MGATNSWLRGGDVSRGGPQVQRTTSISRLRRNRRRRGVKPPAPVEVVMRDGVVLCEPKIVTKRVGENFGHGYCCPCEECRAKGGAECRAE